MVFISSVRSTAASSSGSDALTAAAGGEWTAAVGWDTTDCNGSEALPFLNSSHRARGIYCAFRFSPTYKDEAGEEKFITLNYAILRHFTDVVVNAMMQSTKLL